MSLAVDLDVVGHDLVDDQIQPSRASFAFADAVAVVARVEIEVDAEEGVGPFHPWRIVGLGIGGQCACSTPGEDKPQG